VTRFAEGRKLLKARFMELREQPSDYRLGVPQPPLEKPHPADALLVDLPDPRAAFPPAVDLFALLESRRSRREFSPDPLRLEQISALLWATQGVISVIRDGFATLRTVPSGGSRHPFETYVAASNVDGLAPGIYRYAALKHKLIPVSNPPDLATSVMDACMRQEFVFTAPAVFLWSAVPYRSEWRYGVAAHKTIAQDSGHLCQNMYIACEALGLSTVAIGSYDQKLADELLGLDGDEEFVVYVAPVGWRNH
jgi:SagB-type dehydrogenase family enzyme